MSRAFHIVDVFAEARYAGNQLAVVLDCTGLDAAAMQRIAREMNFSETSFVLDPVPREGGYEVRIFTPRSEVPFAGHPTLGTAFVIREALLGGRGADVTLNLRAGPIPVRFERPADGAEVLWMRQNPPVFGETVDAAVAAGVLGLEPSEVHAETPVQAVSTGLPFWIVPLRGLDAVRRSRLDPARYEALIRGREAKSVFLFCADAEHAGNQFHARMFSPHYGVAEDPATGSANGCLAGYLVRYRCLGAAEIDVRVEQGYEMGRPSLLRLRAVEREGAIDVRVGGRVVAVARGELL